MAAGNTVQLVFAGDSKSLDKTFDNVGAGAKDLAGDFDKAEADARAFGKAMDRAADATDASEGKFMGAADLLDGLGGAFGLPTEGATNLMRSFGDLSGGFAQLGPLVGKVGGSLGALAIGPVGLIIAGVGLLTAGIIALYKNSETFRDIVSAAFNAVKSVAGPVIDAIGGALKWVGGLFGKGGDDAEDMTDAMKAALEKSQADWDDWKGKVASSLDSIVNPLQRARDNSKVSMDEINKNLTDNVAFYSGWISNLKSLTERGFGELANYLYSLGPTAEKAVGEAYRMTDPQLKKLQDNVVGKLDQAGKVGADLLANGIGGKDYGKIGETIGQKVTGGLERIFAPGTIGHQLVTTQGGLLGLPGRAAGGPVTGGQAYVVGERGPEVFVPGMSGAIVPNAAAGGGTTVVQLVLDGRILTEVVHNGLIAKQRRTPLGIAS